mmetsp:Transcript_173430/g.556306  ORF Transcript_173430/g.556306 Transcript_173430/m.556306 type:complete len:379 (+) Transcript_173430:848-1984(+)
MHHGAVQIPAHMRIQALVWPGPANPADLPARQHPIAEAVEVLPEALHNARGNQVDEGIAQASAGVEVHGQVQEVVEAPETFAIEHLQDHGAAVVVGHIPQHDRCGIAAAELKGITPASTLLMCAIDVDLRRFCLPPAGFLLPRLTPHSLRHSRIHGRRHAVQHASGPGQHAPAGPASVKLRCLVVAFRRHAFLAAALGNRLLQLILLHGQAHVLLQKLVLQSQAGILGHQLAQVAQAGVGVGLRRDAARTDKATAAAAGLRAASLLKPPVVVALQHRLDQLRLRLCIAEACQLELIDLHCLLLALLLLLDGPAALLHSMLFLSARVVQRGVRADAAREHGTLRGRATGHDLDKGMPHHHAAAAGEVPAECEVNCRRHR